MHFHKSYMHIICVCGLGIICVTYKVERAREGVRSSAGFATSQRVPGWGFTSDETIPGCRFTARGAGGGKPAHMSAA